MVLLLVFVNKTVTVDENVRFADHTSGIRLPSRSKLAIKWKNDNGNEAYVRASIL